MIESSVYSDPRQIYIDRYIAELRKRWKDLPLSACTEMANISADVLYNMIQERQLND